MAGPGAAAGTRERRRAARRPAVPCTGRAATVAISVTSQAIVATAGHRAAPRVHGAHPATRTATRGLGHSSAAATMPAMGNSPAGPDAAGERAPGAYVTTATGGPAGARATIAIDRHRITLADVARAAGYSRSTASLVFQGSPLVAAATRDRVLAAAEDLGYVYNRRAAGLRMQRSGTVGFLMAGLRNPHFSALFEAVDAELGPSGWTVLLGNTLDDPDRQADLVRTFLEYRVDGLLIVPAIGSRRDMTVPLVNLRVPHVFLTRRIAGLAADYVGANDRRGGELAAQHLLDHGCRRIAFLGGPADVYGRADRWHAIVRIVEAAGARIDHAWSVPTQVSSTDGYDTARRLLARHEPLPDGIICHSDAIAFGLMRALRDEGVTIGEQVRVIGFDDVEHARSWSPSLTSISSFARDVGQAGARLLMKRMAGAAGDPPEAIICEPQLQVRESCGPEA